MPLDGNFHEKPRISEAKRLERFWRWCAIVIAGTFILFLLIGSPLMAYFALEEGESYPLIFIDSILSTLFTLFWITFFTVVLAFLLTMLLANIPYRNFLYEERADFYLYIITSMLFLLLWIFYLEELYYQLEELGLLLEYF